MGKLAAVVLAGCICLAAFVVVEVVSLTARPPTPHEIQVQLEQDVAQLKPTLPQDEGPLVTWFDVEAEWQTMVYKYKVHAQRDLVVAKKKELESQLKGSMVLGAAKMMMPKGVKVKYELYDDRGAYIYTLDLD